MAGRRRKAARGRARRDARFQLALAGILAVLVGVNLYVFLIRPGNIRDLQRKVEEGRLKAQDGGGLIPGLGGGGGAGKTAADPAAGEPGAGDDDRGDGPVAGRSKSGTVQKGDTLSKILAREGLEPPEQQEVIDALDDVMDLRSMREGQAYSVRFDDVGRLVGFEYKASAVTVYVVTRGENGRLVARKAEAKTEVRVEEITGTVRTSLYDAVKSRGESTALVAALADLFAGDLNFYIDTHEGDRFSLVVEKVYLDGELLDYGHILAAEYRGKAGTFRAFRWKDAYYDEKGQSAERSMLKTPLKFARVSSSFNPKRMHPVLHKVKGHWGTDFAAPTGTPVWAAGDARVVSAAAAGGAGNMVVLDHGGGLYTYYMHLSKFAKGLKAGQRVKQKQVIGYVGTTGLSTGPHLHLGVKQGGKWVDWNKLKPRRQKPVPKAEMAEFQQAIAPQVAALERVSQTTFTADSGSGPKAE